MKIKLLLLACSIALLVGCASKVPLAEPAAVETRTPTATRAGESSSSEASAPTVTREIKSVEIVPPVANVAKTIYFDLDSYVVKPEFQATLDAQAKSLSLNRKLKVTLGGHTDDLGGREYNLALGQKRADAVKRALVILGVSEAQMEAVSFGKEKPAVLGTDEAARAQNRRVEIVTP